MILSALALFCTSVNAASQPPASVYDLEYLAALQENSYCSSGEFQYSGLTVGNATLIKSLPYSELSDQRVDVYHDPEYGIVVTYQGTNTTDWVSVLHDLDFIQVNSEIPNLSSSAKVHHGFYQQFQRSWSAVNSTVQAAINDYPNDNITVIGHSMGASIAQLGALALQSQYGIVDRVVVYAPVRTGNPQYAKEFNNIFDDIYTAVWNGQDWVPWILLPELGYAHPNNMIWINPENGTNYQYFENSESWDGPAGKLPKLLTVDTVAGGIQGIVDDLKKGDIYDTIEPILDLLYWSAHEGIYFHTNLFSGKAHAGYGCPGTVGGY